MRRLRWPADTESQLRLLVRAYPVDWREQRGDELVGTVVELLGPRRLGWSLALNIVLGGWRTRLREHPPFGRWLAYRMLGTRMPEQWRRWVRQDITGRFFPLRRILVSLLTFLAVFGGGEVWAGRNVVPWGMFATFAAVQLALAPLFGKSKRWRRRCLSLDPPSDVPAVV